MRAEDPENNRPARHGIALADGWGTAGALVGPGHFQLAPATKPDIPAPTSGATPAVYAGIKRRYPDPRNAQGAVERIHRPALSLDRPAKGRVALPVVVVVPVAVASAVLVAPIDVARHVVPLVIPVVHLEAVPARPVVATDHVRPVRVVAAEAGVAEVATVVKAVLVMDPRADPHATDRAVGVACVTML